MTNRIAEWRHRAGLSYAKLAERMECDTKTVERLEKGHRKLSIQWMERFAKALDVPMADLLPSKIENDSPSIDSEMIAAVRELEAMAKKTADQARMFLSKYGIPE